MFDLLYIPSYWNASVSFCFEKKKIICLEIENQLLTTMHSPVSICSLKFNNRNTRTICEIPSKLRINTTDWSQWQLGLNFNTFTKTFIVFIMLYFQCSVFIHLNGENPQFLTKIWFKYGSIWGEFSYSHCN